MSCFSRTTVDRASLLGAMSRSQKETPDSRLDALNRVFYFSVLSLTPSKTHFRKLKSAYRSKFLAMVLTTSSITMGFDRCPFIPASKDA